MTSYDARTLPRSYPTGRVPPRKLRFPEISRADVYNVSAPFSIDGEVFLAGRVEPRENHDSQVYIFSRRSEEWLAHPRWKPLPLEDPFYFTIRGIPHLGGVETFPGEQVGSLGWKTVVYDIRNLAEPVPVFTGPIGMKDLRFIDFNDGSLGVFTRPQGGIAGQGTVGYMETRTLEGLTHDAIRGATLISAPAPGSWEGVNQPIQVDEDTVGLLGHVAWMEEGKIRHYSAAACTFSRSTRVKTPWRIIAVRSDIPPGPAKRPDLVDVLFPGGLSIKPDGTADLYVGVSDAEAWVLELPYPF